MSGSCSQEWKKHERDPGNNGKTDIPQTGTSGHWRRVWKQVPMWVP